MAFSVINRMGTVAKSAIADSANRILISPPRPAEIIVNTSGDMVFPQCVDMESNAITLVVCVGVNRAETMALSEE